MESASSSNTSWHSDITQIQIQTTSTTVILIKVLWCVICDYITEIDYIVLKKLVDLAVNKENKYKQYIKVPNFDLHEQLEYKLDCKISNQKPRKVLDNYNLLARYKNQKQSCLGFDKDARRIYHINKARLDEAVEDTQYDDLKIKLALIDEKRFIIKPLSSKKQDSEKLTKETKEFDWEI